MSRATAVWSAEGSSAVARAGGGRTPRRRERRARIGGTVPNIHGSPIPPAGAGSADRFPKRPPRATNRFALRRTPHPSASASRRSSSRARGYEAGGRGHGSHAAVGAAGAGEHLVCSCRRRARRQCANLRPKRGAPPLPRGGGTGVGRWPRKRPRARQATWHGRFPVMGRAKAVWSAEGSSAVARAGGRRPSKRRERRGAAWGSETENPRFT